MKCLSPSNPCQRNFRGLLSFNGLPSSIILHLVPFFGFRNARALACCRLWCPPFVCTGMARISSNSFWHFDALSFLSALTHA